MSKRKQLFSYALSYDFLGISLNVRYKNVEKIFEKKLKQM
jgi:hypothetical protein